MANDRALLQLVWGILLALAGIGVFFRIPQVMPKLEKIDQFASVGYYIRFCFYFMGAVLLGGGVKKIYAFYKMTPGKLSEKS